MCHMSLAILYANSNHNDGFYLREAEQSASSFRRYLSDATFILYTNAEGYQSENFDRVVVTDFVVPPQLAHQTHLNGQMLVKQRAMLECEAERVLVLGSDTYALKAAVSEMPRILERFDVAAAHAPYRINIASGNSPIPEISKAFPEFNCDLILYNNTPKVRQHLTEWHRLYEANAFNHPHDQGTFRYVMYFSDLRIATLAPEYNYRGPAVRKDTVILQNRHLLPHYLEQSNSKKPGLWLRARRKICRLLCQHS